MLAIRKYIEDTPVISTEFVSFNIEELDRYKSLFIEFQNKGVIDKNSKFEHSKWILNDSVRNMGIKFNFDEVKFKRMKHNINNDSLNFETFIISVKAYCLYSLFSNDVKTVRFNINSLKSLLSKTDFLTKDSLDEDFFENMKSIWKFAYHLNAFLSFYDTFYYNPDIVEEIYEYHQSMSLKIKESNCNSKYRRLLPLYNTIFKFNDIIEAFIQDSVGDERELFFPIILWWKITSIIPLRSTEFTIIPKNCIEQNDKGKWGINLYRSAHKGSSKKNSKLDIHNFNSKYKLTWHPISKEVIDLINEYKELVECYDHDDNFYDNNSIKSINREYLLSARSYFKYNRNKSSHNIFSYTLDFFDASQFNKLLKRFMHDIIYNKYNIPIVPKERVYDVNSENHHNNSMQMVNMMDTRHFAIMNLVHLGYSPATIQRIVGHDNINTSFSYYDHQEVFTDCYIVSIAKKKAFIKNSEFKNSILDVSFDSIFGMQGNGNIRYNMVKSKDTSGSKIYKKLDNGYCLYDKQDLLPCKLVRGNHNRCKFFAPYETNLSVISDELENISNEISSEIKTLQYLVKHHKIIKDFNNKYHATWNNLHAKELKKAEMIADYIITGIDLED